jgi:aspartate carbamoyltransferase catalytic subunit
MPHFIDIAQLDKNQFINLLTKAQYYCENPGEPLLNNKFVANLFFEPSTRTRCSFEVAAKKLGAHVINLDSYSSSAQKGETVLDTVLNLQAMGINNFVIRHTQNEMLANLAKVLGEKVNIINAGCGTYQHPSQALLDMLTIRQHKPDFAKLVVAIIGDIKHSRVAHSQIAALQLLGVKQIRLIAPPALLPTVAMQQNVLTFNKLDEGLCDVDVIVTLRVQKERMNASDIPDEKSFFMQYGVDATRLAQAKPDAIVLHPGPMNRGVEIADEVADGPQSVILQQVRNGVAVRMALLAEYST